jgi:peptidoglycan hydrolase-like protein with peptidoglycan-binding domain
MLRAASLALTLLLAGAVPAQADLAQALAAYDEGRHTAAFAEFRDLAEQGDADAQYMLGRMYARGEGTLQDYARGHAWLNLAAASGHRLAAGERDSLQRRMTTEQVAEAQRIARQFEPRRAEAPPPRDDTPATREEAAAIQRALAERGYDAGPADGIPGPRTRAAIRAYQEDAGLPADGQATRGLAQRLAELPAPPAPAEPAPPEPAPVAADPWPVTLVDVDFRDYDSDRDPVWQVAAGEWIVDRQGRLRSTVRAPEPRPAAERPEDMALAVLGAVLGQALGTPEAAAGRAEVFLPRAVTNAFALDVRLSAEVTRGALVLGPYRGGERARGYRLAYLKGEGERLELRHLGERGHDVVAAHDGPLDLADGRTQRLRWTRDGDGLMVVALGDRELIRARDRRHEGRFDGLVLQNLGGDYAVRSVEIRGTE